MTYIDNTQIVEPEQEDSAYTKIEYRLGALRERLELLAGQLQVWSDEDAERKLKNPGDSHLHGYFKGTENAYHLSARFIRQVISTDEEE